MPATITSDLRRVVMDRSIIRDSAVASLGQVGPRRFVTIAGETGEWILDAARTDLPEREGTFVESTVYAADDPQHQTPPISTTYRELHGPLPAGSYEEARAKAEAEATRRAGQDAPAVFGFRPIAHELLGRKVKAGGRVRPAVVREAVTDVAGIVERIESTGARLALSTDDEAIVIVAPGGRPRLGLPELVERLRPVLLPFLRTGKAPSCRVSKGCKAPATTVATGVPWCGDCLPGVMS